MALLSDINPTTELEAVNEMLAAIGEAPVESIDTAALDSGMAVNALKATLRSLLSKRWKFNTEHGLELAPTDSFDWTDRNGNTLTLNVFTRPENLAGFRVTAVPWQQGRNYLDLTLRLSKVYQDASGSPVEVFYDRTYNRDGLPHEYIYIDPIWLVSFEEMPEVARRFVTLSAARSFAQRLTGDAQVSGFSRQDELLALRDLKKTEGEDEQYNIFDNASVTRIMGGRTPGPAGFSDWRGTVGRG